jgi:HEAT repeat protein
MPGDDPWSVVKPHLERDDGEGAIDAVRSMSDPGAALESLARSPNRDVRAWVAAAAADILGAGSSHLLRQMLDDSDADVRVTALAMLEQVDPKAVPRLLTKLRRRLSSVDDDEVIATAWTVARLGDRQSADVLRQRRDEFPSWNAKFKALDSILVLLEDPESLPALIRSHDHDRMLWISYAAKVHGSAEAIGALRECAESAPDTECRSYCEYALKTSPS